MPLSQRPAAARRRRLPALAALLAVALLCGPAALASPAPARPLVGAPQVTSYSADTFNAPGQVWTITQGPRGLLYFGVSGGVVVEYDGALFRKVYLSSDIVRSLAVDQQGTLWVGGSSTFGYLAPDQVGHLHYVSLMDKLPAQARQFSDVWQILPTSHGVYLRTFERLFRWDGQQMHSWEPAGKGRFQSLSEVNGHVYTAQGGIGLQEIEGDELRTLPGGEAYKDAAKLYLHPYGDGRMLISSRDHLLTLYDGQKSVPFPTAADAYLTDHKTYTSLLLRDGSLAITTLHGGVVIVGHDGSLRQTISEPEGLVDSAATSTFQDRDGALWIGTQGGISRAEVNSPISVVTNQGGLDFVRSQGNAYVSNTSGSSGVQRIAVDPKTSRPTLVPVQITSQAWTMLTFKDPAGHAPDQTLVATFEGVQRLDGDTLTPAVPGLHSPSEQSYDIHVSQKDPARVLIAHADGVSSIRWTGKTWVDEGRLPVVYDSHLIDEDSTGAVWASGSPHGLLRIQVPATGMRDAKAEELGVSAGLPEGATNAAVVDGKLYTAVSRVRHMYRWDDGAHRFVVDDQFVLPIDSPSFSYTLSPLGPGRVFSITLSSDGRRMAMFTRQPDGSWKKDEDTYRQLTRFTLFGVRQDTDGSLWFPGTKLVRFDPRTARDVAPRPFPTLVREVVAGSRTIYGGAVPQASEASLPAGSSAVTFQYAALTCGNPAETVYQYMLEGADRDWSDWSKEKQANYSGLGPGSYRFRVRSRTDEGQPGAEGVYLFRILPPWYRTDTAYVIYLLLFLLITYIAWRLISRYERQKARRKTEQLVEQARALEATVAERTGEIRAQAAEIAAQKDSIELLSEIGKEITASLDLNTILFKLYERVNQIVDAGIFGVGLYRPEKRLIEYTLAIENGKRYAPYTRSFDDKNQFAVWCIEHRKPILLNDVDAESSQYIADYRHTGGVLEDGSFAQPPGSMIYLPLVAQERVLGVLSIQSLRKHAYTEQHLSLLENLAAYTTIALDNANAYTVINEREHEVRERAAELVTINRITQALAAQLDRDSLIQFVGEQVRELFHASIAYVSLLHRPTMTLEFPYSFGEDGTARPFGTGLTSQIIRTGQPLLINEDMERNRARLKVEQIGRNTASYLGVPIPSGGQVIGVISVQSTDQEGRFTEADQRLLSTIASAVGVAFHNAKLFEDARQARAAAEEADAAKSSFLSTVSHELRTPLTSVLGFAKIIRRRLEERLFPLIPEQDRKVQQTKVQVMENLGVVVSEGERLTKLIDDVLDLAKIEAGKFSWNMGTVSMSEVIERALAATASLFEAKNLHLVREVAPHLPDVEGDQDRLIQVVINLISNAVKFTDSGSITCSALRRGGEIVVSVKDSGIGIAPADQPKVFEKFKQVGDTLTDKPKGTGLGLPICKEIVEYHGGHIWVESEAGHGSTFSFSIPLAGQTPHAEQPTPRRKVDVESLVRHLREQASTSHSHNKSVLVVDDDPNIRSLLQQELTEAGYSVRLAENGSRALALIREETPGLVILDVMMPEMNGFDVAAVLKSDPVTMDIPIIILSIVEDKERGYRLGVDRYLKKPIDTASLFHEVGTLLDQGKSRKKVMVVDEDASTIRTLTDVLETRGYEVVESDGTDLISRAVHSKPDIIILNSLLSGNEGVKALRFEKGLEHVLFLVYP